MTKEEHIKQRIKFLEQIKDSIVDPVKKQEIEDTIEDYKQMLSQVEKEEQQRTTGQKVGGTVGRLSGLVVGTVMGVVDDCLTGNTDKKETQKTRAKYAIGGEKVGTAIGNVSEKLIYGLRKGRK